MGSISQCGNQYFCSASNADMALLPTGWPWVADRCRLLPCTRNGFTLLHHLLRRAYGSSMWSHCCDCVLPLPVVQRSKQRWRMEPLQRLFILPSNFSNELVQGMSSTTCTGHGVCNDFGICDCDSGGDPRMFTRQTATWRPCHIWRHWRNAMVWDTDRWNS